MHAQEARENNLLSHLIPIEEKQKAKKTPKVFPTENSCMYKFFARRDPKKYVKYETEPSKCSSCLLLFPTPRKVATHG
jgi:hypothetical protein